MKDKLRYLTEELLNVQHRVLEARIILLEHRLTRILKFLESLSLFWKIDKDSKKRRIRINRINESTTNAITSYIDEILKSATEHGLSKFYIGRSSSKWYKIRFGLHYLERGCNLFYIVAISKNDNLIGKYEKRLIYKYFDVIENEKRGKNGRTCKACKHYFVYMGCVKN